MESQITKHSVRLIGYSDACLIYKFTLDGQDQFGSINGFASIIINGQERGHGHFGNQVSHYFNEFDLDQQTFVDATRCRKSKTKVLQDGNSVSVNWHSMKLFIGDEMSNIITRDSVVGRSVTVAVEAELKGIKTVVVTSNPFEATLKVVEGQDVPHDADIFCSRYRPFFKDGLPVSLRRPDIYCSNFKEKTEIFVDLIKSKKDPTRYSAIISYSGVRPPEKLIKDYIELSNNFHKGHVDQFFFDEIDGKAVGGILQLELDESDKRNSFRIIFDRSDVYLFGKVLSKANLQYILPNEFVQVAFHNVEIMVGNDLQKARQIYGDKAEEFNFFRARAVLLKTDIVNVVSEEAPVDIDTPPKDHPILKRHGIAPENFDKFMDGTLSLEEGPVIPARTTEKTDSLTEKVRHNPDWIQASAEELVPPDKLEAHTVKGFFKILSGPHTSSLAVFDRTVITIHGCDMSKANLVDFLTKQMIFNIEYTTPPDNRLDYILVTKAWIGSKPEENCSTPTNEDKKKLSKYLLLYTTRGSWMPEEVDQLLDGQSTKPFFTLTPSVIAAKCYPAKIERICLSYGQGQFGILKIIEDTLTIRVAFKVEQCTVMLHSLYKADLLALPFSSNEKFYVEIRQMEAIDRAMWLPMFHRARHAHGLTVFPTHVATLVYIGSRSKPLPSWVDAVSVETISCNYNLIEWLKSRKMTPEVFYEVLMGKNHTIYQQMNLSNAQPARATPPAAGRMPHPIQPQGFMRNEFGEPQRNQFEQQPPRQQQPLMTNGPSSSSNPSIQAANQTLQTSQSIVERVMQCINSNDPRVTSLITSEEEYEIAGFIAETLTTALKRFEEKKNFRNEVSDAQQQFSTPQQPFDLRNHLLSQQQQQQQQRYPQQQQQQVSNPWSQQFPNNYEGAGRGRGRGEGHGSLRGRGEGHGSFRGRGDGRGGFGGQGRGFGGDFGRGGLKRGHPVDGHDAGELFSRRDGFLGSLPSAKQSRFF